MTRADLSDTPYTFVRQDGRGIVLRYGGTHTPTTFERWIPAGVRSSACNVFQIRFRRRWYRFETQISSRIAATNKGV